MSGNKTFRHSPKLWNGKHEYDCTARKFSGNLDSKKKVYELEKKKPSISKRLNIDYLIDDTNKSKINEIVMEKTPLLESNKQEIRMQEIEEFILENSKIRNIYGNLCIWNGSYYKQFDLRLFTEEVRKILPKSSQKRISHFSRFKEAYEYIQANTAIKQFSEKDIGIAQNLIVFRNGVYDGKNEKLLRKESCYPVIFDINADYIKTGDLSTPCFDGIINKATGYDENVIKLCYQILGYIFSQGNEAKKFFVFGTAPDSGKSIIGEFIAKILGADNVSTVSLNDFGTRFALGTINQKVLNYNMDLSETELDRNSIQKLKQLTGDPRVESETKFVQGKTVIHHCKFLFATNHPIKLRNDDLAFYNRLVLVPFIYSVNEYERDYELPYKLWKERNKIATKAAHAYSELLRNNLVFQKSSLANSMLFEWRGEDDSKLLKSFYNEKCEVADETSFVATEIMFKVYQEFCLYCGQNVKCMDKIQFSRKFRSLFNLKSAKKRVEGFSSPVNGYLGIKIRENE